MRSPALLLAILLLASAGCIKDQPGAEKIDEMNDPPGEVPDDPDPTPPTPTTPPTQPPPAKPAQPEPPGVPQPAPAPVAPRVDVLSWNGSITGAALSSAGQPVPAPYAQSPIASAKAENVDGSFDVAAGLQGIVVELTWIDPQFDLDLRLDAPDAADAVPPSADGPSVATRNGHYWTSAGGEPGQPNARETILVTDPEALALAGAWSWFATPKGPANDVAFTVYVSLFYDAAPGDGYTATTSDNP